MSKTEASIRRSIMSGLVVSALLVFGVGGWAASAQLSGAVIAPGQLVVESHVKKVQHPTGGVVGELLVKEGQHVKAGQVVLRLDETIVRANYAVVANSMDELSVRRARLAAEQDGAERLTLSPDLTQRRAQLEILLAAEERLFLSRTQARNGQKEQLRERVGQLQEQIGGMAVQISAKQREIELITAELEGVRNLFKKKLIPIQRVTALERDAARLEGERGALIASVAQAKGRVSETELQILQIDQDVRAEVGRELADVRSKLAELAEKRIAAEDQLNRIVLRAPQDGMVHQLTVHTVGGVISAGEPVMLIVPKADALRVEVRIAPQEIDHLRLGQKAILRFSAFNQSTTPEIAGEVEMISADVSSDQKTGAAYYTVRIGLPSAELGRLAGLRLTPGMPVEAFIETGERTVLTYLTKPLTDQMARTFRER